MKPFRLTELIHGHLDSALTPDEARELSAELVSNPEARRLYWSHAAIHGLLPEAVHLAWLSGATPQATKKIVPMPVSVPSQSSPFLRVVGLAAAACLMVTVGWWSTTQRWWPWSDHSVATIVRTHDAVWENRGQIARDSLLLPGRYGLTSGAAEFKFRSGAHFIVEAPAEIELMNRNQARLMSGQASGFVPPEAKGFTVVTPTLKLVDLGTAFGLKVPPSGPVEAHVFTGEVSVFTPSDSARRLTGGEAVRVTEEGFTKILSRPDDFLTSEGLAARNSDVARRHLAAWRVKAEQINRDPATLVHYTFEEQPSVEKTLRNKAATRIPGALRATIIGANWCEGRWPGKKALAFRESGDRVRFRIPGEYPTLTLFASVRIDALPREFNALLMTENHALGDLRWQLYREGSLAFSLRTAPSVDDLRLETVKTKPMFTKTNLERWCTLTTVLDSNAGKVSHYVDGVLVSEGTLERKTPAQLNSMELGNWGVQLDDPRWTWTKAGGPSFYDRHFVGRIDEFALISRAMSPEEIWSLSQAGQ